MTKKMSILIIGNYPPPFGGVPRHIEYLVPFLVRNGWDVHVLSGGRTETVCKDGFTLYRLDRNSYIWGTLSSLVYALLTPGQRYRFNFKLILRTYPGAYLRYVSFISMGRKIIKKNKINIISAYNLYTYAPIGAVLSEEYNIPLFVTNFGEIYSMRSMFEKNLEFFKYVHEVPKKLLAMSRHCADSYKLLGFSPSVEVIPYGVNISSFSPSNDRYKIRQNLGITNNDLVVAFVGRMNKDMGLHTLLDAIMHLLQINEKLKFIIVGEKGELLPVALDLAKKYINNVFVIPSVSFENLPLYYAAATIVIAPTQGDRACGSLAAIEAMATAKPVIAAKVGGIPEIVIDGETGLLIKPGNIAVLVDAVLKLLKDEAMIKRMGQAGRKRVEDMFDEERLDQIIEQRFREFAGV